MIYHQALSLLPYFTLPTFYSLHMFVHGTESRVNLPLLEVTLDIRYRHVLIESANPIKPVERCV